MLVCGENESICEACGCYTCVDPEWEVYCDFRPDAGPGLLVCTEDGCFDKQPCEDGAYCESGWNSGMSACSDELSCDDIGCTSPRVWRF